MDTYACRLLVLNQECVKCEIRNPKHDIIFEDNDVFNYAQYKDEISRLSQKARENDINAGEIKQLGEDLFNTLFNGNIRSKFLECRAETHAHSNLLRIELEIDEPSLPGFAALPWEFMYAPDLDERGNFWLATDPHLAFMRRRPRMDVVAGFAVASGEKMRIATVIASPQGKTVPYEDFWEDIKKTEQSNNDIQLLELVTEGTKRNIDKILNAKPHVFHLLAHGDLKIEGKGNTGFVHLVDVTGDALALSGPEFAELFTRYGPPIVVLQVCESGAQDESDALSGVASQVVDQNVPNVVAMQYPVSNVIARQFMGKFYECIAKREPVEKAVQEGRREITLGAAGHASRDFTTPILYSRLVYDKVEKIIDWHIGDIHFWVGHQNKLTEALLECESVADPVTRQQIFARLPKDIRHNIGVPNAGARVQVSNAVRISTGYPDGVKNLIESVEFFERDTVAMQNVKNLLKLD